MMGLQEGRKSFKIGLVVYTQYQVWQTDGHTDIFWWQRPRYAERRAGKNQPQTMARFKSQKRQATQYTQWQTTDSYKFNYCMVQYTGIDSASGISCWCL